MWTADYEVFIAVYEFAFLLCVSAPEDEYDSGSVVVDAAYGCVSELFPAFSCMGACCSGAYCEHGVEEEDALISPMFQVAMIGSAYAEVAFYFLEYVEERAWGGDVFWD